MRPNTRRPFVVSALATVALLVGGVLGAAPASAATPSGGIMGVDASGSVDWTTVPSGTQFAYVEATDRAAVNSHFYDNWVGAAWAGLARGAYHFGVPNKAASNGATQAAFFFQNGGGYSTASPNTLPPVLDVEFDPDAGTADPTGCWNLQPFQTAAWISSFVATFTKLSGRTPVIYTSKSYWQACLGGVSDFNNYPLWISDINSETAPALGFGGWTSWKFWQYEIPGGSFDYDEFNGTLAQLKSFGSFPRIAGPDRYGTGVTASQSFASGVDTVFVADAANYPDALAAGAAAGVQGGPVLLVPPSGALPASVIQALAYLKPTHIVIVGGSGVVSNDVAGALAAYGSVSRQSGSDRYGTSATVAMSNFASGVSSAYVVMGTDWPDALSGSALAASKQGSGPMFLIEQNSIPTAVANALNSLKPQNIVVLGGSGVVSSTVQKALAKYTASGTGANVSRLGGADRYGTSVLVAQQLDALNGTSPAPVYFASGATFPDALVGAPVSALTSSPLLLVPPAAAVPGPVSAEVTALHAPSMVIMGGAGAVSLSVQRSLSSLIG